MFDAKRRLQYFERRMKHYRTERDRLFKRNDLSDDDKRRQLFRMFETRDDMLAEMVKIMADIRDERSIMEAALGTGP
jgi:lipase chaperone LimK